MKKLLLSLSLAIALCSAVDAQKSAKSIYAELGGPGLLSFNYDTRFTKTNDGIGGRIGIGGYSTSDEKLLTIPLGLNYLLSKDQKNYFELGAGVTFVDYKDEYSMFSNNDGTFNSTFGHLTFGYRLQPTNGGFLFRAAIVPVFSKEGFIPYYAGIGFGYKF